MIAAVVGVVSLKYFIACAAGNTSVYPLGPTDLYPVMSRMTRAQATTMTWSLTFSGSDYDVRDSRAGSDLRRAGSLSRDAAFIPVGQLLARSCAADRIRRRGIEVAIFHGPILTTAAPKLKELQILIARIHDLQVENISG